MFHLRKYRHLPKFALGVHLLSTLMLIKEQFCCVCVGGTRRHLQILHKFPVSYHTASVQKRECVDEMLTKDIIQLLVLGIMALLKSPTGYRSLRMCCWPNLLY